MSRDPRVEPRAGDVAYTTLRLKVKRDAYAWLNEAAIEVNQVWNWAAATCADAADRNRRPSARFLTWFDLNNLSAGAGVMFAHIGADSIQCVNRQYAAKIRQFRRPRLKWRTSFGSRRSLGWVPFKGANIRRTKSGVRMLGKSFRLFDVERIGAHRSIWRLRT